MPKEDRPKAMLLPAAFLTWTERRLLDDIQREERRHGIEALAHFYEANPCWRRMIEADEAKQVHTADVKEAMLDGVRRHQSDLPRLRYAWREAEVNFRERVQTGTVITGTQTTPELARDRTFIPPEWILDAELNLNISTLTLSGRRFSGVELERTIGHEVAQRNISTLINCYEIDRDTACKLSADALALIYTVVREKVAAGDLKELLGKDTLGPLLCLKLDDRAKESALEETLGVEAAVLADWIKLAAPHHHPPSKATVEKLIRNRYALAKRRSKAAIQKF